jgi:hypothetical protein
MSFGEFQDPTIARLYPSAPNNVFHCRSISDSLRPVNRRNIGVGGVGGVPGLAGLGLRSDGLLLSARHWAKLQAAMGECALHMVRRFLESGHAI